MPGAVLPFAETDCGSCPIRYRAVCSDCSNEELAVLDAIKSYKTYKAGSTIVWAGDEMQFIGSVVVGVVSLSKTMEDGRRQMIGLLLPSDFVGRPHRSVAPYDVVAVSDVTLCRFRKVPFEKLLDETPSIRSRLLEMTLDELDAAREWMLLLGRKTAREKIASLLLVFARRENHLQLSRALGQVIFDLPLSREKMADYLGLTLETVSRQMSALVRERVIALHSRRRIIVPDFARLMNETGDDADGGLPA
ncbi:MAG: transcriptional regulator FnrL [Paracoccaceae bacterium]